MRGEDRRELGRSVTPNLPSTSKSVTPTRPILSPTHQLETAAVGEQFVSDYSVYEVPILADHIEPSKLTSLDTQLINRALLARVELIEVENIHLKAEAQQRVKSQF